MRVWMLLLVGLVACGGDDKKAKDPSDVPPQDEVPKWEGAAPPPPKLEQEPGKSSGTGRQVHEAEPRRTDQYDKEATEVVLRRAARQVKDNCGAAKDDDGKATGPWGKATIQVELGRNGHSKGITVPEPYAGKPVGKCIEKAFTNLTFPPWGGSDTTVPWEVELVNPAHAKK
jgi:hypothetical protein